uniref:Putative cytidylyltransferase n=1 Tax=viral metagenome TaxID=1070528 RepID=A0A6M3JJD1_9ZZZZ
MIYAICIGRDGSRGFPLKNTHKINDMPLMAYPIQAALNSKYVDEVYFSTESRKLKYVAEKYGAIVIDRPKELATDEALSDDVWVHAYEWIMENGSINTYGDDIALGDDTIRELKKRNIEFALLMFANSPCVNGWMIDEMIEILRKDDYADSICTVSKYNMYSPARMRKFKTDIGKEIYIEPYKLELAEASTCDRDSVDDCYIYDCSCCVVKPKCIEEMENGMPPQKWLGNNIIGYKQSIPTFDIDFEWQLGALQYWIDRNWY